MSVEVLRHWVSTALGRGLIQIFSEGTGCIVQLEDPQVSFFPIRAQVKNVRIYHATESPEEGFRVDQISTRLVLHKLSLKQIFLADLTLEGTHIASRGEETGFINTLDFIFRDSPNNNFLQQRPWHSFLTRGWIVRVGNALIRSRRDGQTHLLIAADNTEFRWKDIVFSVVRTKNEPPDPFRVSAYAGSFEIAQPSAVPRSLGEFIIVGRMGESIVKVFKATLTSSPSLASQARLSQIIAHGDIHLKTKREYDLDVTVNVFPSYLQSFLPEFAKIIDRFKPELSLLLKVGGPLSAPAAQGSIAIQLENGLLFPSFQQCSLKTFAGKFEFDKQHFLLEKTGTEDLFTKAIFGASFAPTVPFSAQIKIDLEQKNPLVNNCLLEESAQNLPGSDQAAATAQAKTASSIQKALELGFLDSHSELTLQGTGIPLTLKGTFLSKIHPPDTFQIQEIKADFTLKDNILSTNFIENAIRIPGDSTKTGTVSHPLDNGAIHGKLHYHIPRQELFVDELNVSQYPLRWLIDQIDFFSQKDSLRPIRQVITNASLLNATLHGKGSVLSATIEGGGSIEFSQVNLGPLKLDQGKVNITATANTIQFPEIVLGTKVGQINGQAQISKREQVAANFFFDNLVLTELPQWDEYLPNLRGTTKGTFELTGSLDHPNYKGEVVLETTHMSGDPDTVRNTLSLIGDKEQVKVLATVINNTARVELHYPLGEAMFQGVNASSGNVQLKIQTNDFPLDYLLFANQRRQARTSSPEPSQPFSKDFPFSEPSSQHQDRGFLTAQLMYEGPRSDPLLGHGTLHVDRLELFAQDNFHAIQKRPLLITIANGALTFTDVILVANNKDFTVRGFVDHQSGWHTKLSGIWNLANLVGKSDFFEQISGIVRMDLSVEGPPMFPLLNGPLSVERGFASFPLGPTVIGVTNLKLLGEFANNEFVLHTGEGQIGDGKIHARGGIKNTFLSDLRQVNLGVTFDDIQLEPWNKVAVDLQGKLDFERLGSAPAQLNGEIRLVSGTYEDSIDLFETIRSVTNAILGVSSKNISTTSFPRRKSIRETEEPSSPLEFYLRIFATGSFLIETDVVQTELRGNLLLLGNTDRPLLDGSIEALEGVFGLRSNQFDLVTGKMTFSKLSPISEVKLDILGETTLITRSGEEELVRLAVAGTLANPVVLFSSDSGLSQNEIASLLGVGAELHNLGFINVGARTNQSLGKLLNPISDMSLKDRLSGIAGFSEVRLDASASSTTGEVVPKIIAKRPLFNGLELSLQSELNKRQGSEINIGYPLSLSLEAIGGWKNTTVTNPDITSGALDFSLRYHFTFPGLQLLPPKFSPGHQQKK